MNVSLNVSKRPGFVSFGVSDIQLINMVKIK